MKTLYKGKIMKKNTNVITGHLIRTWEYDVVSVPAILNLNTYEVCADITNNGFDDVGCLLSEVFESLDDTIYPICPQCHNALKVVMVPDDVGNGLHEELECPLCEHFD